MANVDSRPEGERKRWRGGPSCLLFPPVSIKSVLKTLPENSPSQVLNSELVLPPQPSGKLLAAPRKPRTGQHFWGSCERKMLIGREIESTRPARTGDCARPLLQQALLGDDVMSKRELANHQRVKAQVFHGDGGEDAQDDFLPGDAWHHRGTRLSTLLFNLE